jgi:hypothetical protein
LRRRCSRARAGRVSQRHVPRAVPCRAVVQVVEVVSGDCLVIKDAANGAERRVNLSRCGPGGARARAKVRQSPRQVGKGRAAGAQGEPVDAQEKNQFYLSESGAMRSARESSACSLTAAPRPRHARRNSPPAPLPSGSAPSPTHSPTVCLNPPTLCLTAAPVSLGRALPALCRAASARRARPPVSARATPGRPRPRISCARSSSGGPWTSRWSTRARSSRVSLGGREGCVGVARCVVPTRVR